MTGRPEKPIDPAAPYATFAYRLRRLRAASNLTLDELSVKVNISKSTLSAAAAGRRLPSWHTARAYVSGCGGCVAEWQTFWHQQRGQA